MHKGIYYDPLCITYGATNAQRLGYILDAFRARRLSTSVHRWLGQQKPHWVGLWPGRSVAGAREDRRWHVLVNEPLEVEA